METFLIVIVSIVAVFGGIMLFWGRIITCNHEYEFLDESKTFTRRYEYPTKITKTFMCKKCGKVKRVNI